MIHFTPEIMQVLETIGAQTRGLEFSGFGFVDREPDRFTIYDFVLLDIGSEGYTEIPTSELLKLMERDDSAKMKCWIHRHPVGNGIPGDHNWSGTDTATIHQYPLGGIPELVKWSLSCVRTPRGWVGRFDNHIKDTTAHLDVFPRISPIWFDQVGELLGKRYARRTGRRNGRSSRSSKAIDIAETGDLFATEYRGAGKKIHELTDKEWQFILTGDYDLLDEEDEIYTFGSEMD